MEKYTDNEGRTGVWRTISGRRVFIRDGEDLADAMERSGKFKTKFSPEEVDKLKQQGRKGLAQAIDKENGKYKVETGNPLEEMANARMQEKLKKYDKDLDYVKRIMAGEKVIDDKYNEELSLDTAKKWLRDDYVYKNSLGSYSPEEIDERIAKDLPEIFGKNNELKETLISDASNDLGIEPGSDEEWMLNELYETSDDYVEPNYTNKEATDMANEFMSANVGDWNNQNQEQRDATANKILSDIESKYGNKLEDKELREQVMAQLEDQNFHTMVKAIDNKYNEKYGDIALNKAIENDKDIQNLYNKYGNVIDEENPNYKDPETERISKYFNDQEKQALESKDYGYGYSKETLSKVDDDFLKNAYEKNKELVEEYTNKYNQDLTYDQRVKRNKQDTIWDGGMKTKYEAQLEDIKAEINNRGLNENPKGIKTGDSINYRGKNEDKLYENVKVDDLGNVYYSDMKLDNDKILGKYGEPYSARPGVYPDYENAPYEYKSAYNTYREKRNRFEGLTKDEYGNTNWDNYKDAEWTGKEYTNDEFLDNLEDENWHTERKMLLDAGLTNKQMEFVKNNTKFHNGSPSLDREITEELIKGAKGQDYRTPESIISGRNQKEVEKLKNDLDIISKYGKYKNGKYVEGVSQDYQSYDEKKERYKALTGKDYDDSDISIPYDPKKTYEYSNGLKIDQNLMKENYSGYTAEKMQHEIDFNKKQLMNYAPEEREIHNAVIKEMEKYRDSIPKYESRISDDYGTKDWGDSVYPFSKGSAWKGTKSGSNLTTTEIAKEITSKMKEAYPGVKISRKTSYFSGGSSADFSIMESDKPMIRDISDFSDSEIGRLYNRGYNSNYYKTQDEFKEHLAKELTSGNYNINSYNVDDDYRLTPYGKQVIKDLNKVSNAYNYDESDSMTDYFNTGFYSDISIGKYNKPYQVKSSKVAKTKVDNVEAKIDRYKKRKGKNN